MLGCCAGKTGITVSQIALFRNKHPLRTSISVRFGNDLPIPITRVAPICRSWHGSPTKPRNPLWLRSLSSHQHLHKLQINQVLDWAEKGSSHEEVSSPGTLVQIRRNLHSVPELYQPVSGCPHAAARHFRFCFCSEIRKAASTCNKITALSILCSSSDLYACFLTKCLCCGIVK